MKFTIYLFFVAMLMGCSPNHVAYKPVVADKERLEQFDAASNVPSPTIERVQCDSNFSKDCIDCFASKKPLKVGFSINDQSLSFSAGSKEDVIIYEDEIISDGPLFVKPFYGNGVLEIGNGQHIAPEINKKRLFKDENGRIFLKVDKNTTEMLFYMGKDFFIKFAKLTDEVKAGGKDKPLYQTSWNFTVHEGKKTRKFKSCFIKYPTW